MKTFPQPRAKLCLILLASFVVAHLPLAEASEKILFQSPEKQTTLIELFTAEGCSSCPPAEAWLSALRDRPGLWKTFVPLAFHVDYWDKRGWKDRFASPAYTARQRAYAAAWKNGAAYTPAFAVNGREERSPVLPSSRATGGTLRILPGGAENRFVITFTPESNASSDWEAHLALLGSGVTTKVSAGENAGRELRHDFVVLDYQHLPMKRDGTSARADVAISSNEIGAIPRPALAAWVTARGQLLPVQATGGWLSATKR